jgi:hypothetical protein
VDKEAEEIKTKTSEGNLDIISSFEGNFFDGELNRFVGSGGEILIKGGKEPG